MEHLRLILILIGLVILALIWLLHKPEGRRPPPGARRREPKIEVRQTDPPPEPSAELAEPEQIRLPDPDSEFEHAAEPPKRREPVLGETEQKSPPVRPTTPPAAESPQRDRAQAPLQSPVSSASTQPPATAPRIVTLYLRARGQRRISGLSLLDAAIKAGLRFGEMKIFHRRHRGEPRPVFSMANITRPGSFDPSGWNLFQTPGVTLFMTLPGPVSALDAWDAMLATGQRLSGILEADLLDRKHGLQ
jgi:cell division protein ZipA